MAICSDRSKSDDHARHYSKVYGNVFSKSMVNIADLGKYDTLIVSVKSDDVDQISTLDQPLIYREVYSTGLDSAKLYRVLNFDKSSKYKMADLKYPSRCMNNSKKILNQRQECCFNFMKS